MSLIDHLRVIVPLLDLRVRESGHPGDVEMPGVELGLARERTGRSR